MESIENSNSQAAEYADPGVLPGDRPGEVHFAFPSTRSVFSDICAILPWCVVGAIYVPYLSGLMQALLLIVVFIILAARLAVDYFIGSGKGITLGAAEIRVGRRTARWDQIKEVRKVSSRLRRSNWRFREGEEGGPCTCADRADWASRRVQACCGTFSRSCWRGSRTCLLPNA